MIEVIPTVVPNSVDDLDVFLARCRTFSAMFHVDATDGVFAPNSSWMPTAGQQFPEADHFFYEAHLMVSHPEAIGSAFIAAGAKRLIAHAGAFESEREAMRTLDVWRKAGLIELGIALLIETPLEALEPFIVYCDSITLMSIARIGVQGIPFDERAYGRVADVHARYPDLVIEVDGGIGAQQIAALARAGASRFAVGSAIAKSADPAGTHKELLAIAQAAV